MNQTWCSERPDIGSDTTQHKTLRASARFSFACVTGRLPMGEVGKLPEKRVFEAQRAMVAAKLANMPLGGAQYRSANLQTDAQPVSQSDAAKLPSTPMWGYRTIG